MLHALLAALLAFLQLPNDTVLNFNGDTPIPVSDDNHITSIRTIEDVEKTARDFVEAYFLSSDQSSSQQNRMKFLRLLKV